MIRVLWLCLALSLGGCAPMLVQAPLAPVPGFRGPHIEAERFVSFDGARLGLTVWSPTDGPPRAAVVAVHGMNDYANAFHIAAPIWAKAGIVTYAYDQRGFGRSPSRGVWAGHELMAEDLRTLTGLVRERHPGLPVTLVGESMGGAIAILAMASDRPAAADRVVLLSPAVWGWRNQPLPNRTLLWFAANFTGSKVYTPPAWLTRRITPTDNRDELVAMGRDPLMVWGARSDALYGLVEAMDLAWRSIGEVRAPVLYLYGANDQIIPPRAALSAAGRLQPKDRSVYYPQGYHLLTRDLEGGGPIGDAQSFILDPQAQPPSGLGPIPPAHR